MHDKLYNYIIKLLIKLEKAEGNLGKHNYYDLYPRNNIKDSLKTAI